ncbi:phenylalanine--tRNA ligase subunit beta [soil metagenome]
MNISYRWLTELVQGLSLTPGEVADLLAMLGAPVDEIVDIGGPLKDIIIARIEQTGRHPNADRLSLCTVDDGSGETRQVVCGAPNVRVGAYYPFAPVGSSLPDGMVIRKAKIRGVESQGMLCSARELGLGRDHEGILELHGQLEPGRSFIESAALADTRIVVDVTPNRPDLLSHFGVAREVAAATGLSAALQPLPDGTQPTHGATQPPQATPAEPLSTTTVGTDAAAKVTVEADDLCPRYLGLVIRDVRVGPSPEWLAGRLRSLGLRPISNIVDATNYVLHELGQPLHAFDLARLGTEVVVRRARAGERITTLDGVDRELADDMLVIADAMRPVAIAGVMGGADTEVTHDTRAILLECALFDPRSVRNTRRALGLSTDASYRFERGVDPDGMLRAMQRAAALIIAVSGGRTDGVIAEAGPGLKPVEPVSLRLSRVEQVLGQRFDARQVQTFLEPLGFGVRAAADVCIVDVPGHRRYDVSREEDLIEDIARRHGYDNFPDNLRPFRPSAVPSHPLFALERRLRTLLAGRGLLEAHTAPFAPEAEGDVPLLLPLATTESRLRRALLPGLLRRAEYNFARGARSIRLFELGTVFAPAPADSTTGLPVERTRLAVVLTGLRRPPHWSEPDSAFDVWDLKALAAELAGELGFELRPGADHSLLERGLSFRLLSRENGEESGVAGQVRASAVDAPAWAAAVWGMEVELAVTADRPPARHRGIPAYPAVERDLALLVPQSTPAGAVTVTLRESGGQLLESAEPFDVYTGKGVAEDARSIAFRLRFRAPDRTLTDAEVDDIVHRVLRRLNDDLGVQQRA